MKLCPYIRLECLKDDCIAYQYHEYPSAVKAGSKDDGEPDSYTYGLIIYCHALHMVLERR